MYMSNDISEPTKLNEKLPFAEPRYVHCITEY